MRRAACADVGWPKSGELSTPMTAIERATVICGGGRSGIDTSCSVVANPWAETISLMARRLTSARPVPSAVNSPGTSEPERTITCAPGMVASEGSSTRTQT